MKRMHRTAAALAVAALVSAANGAELPPTTAIDDYVRKPDDSFSWRVISSAEADGVASVVVEMTSQQWLTPAEVDRPEWRHWLTLSIPSGAASETALLFIGGGSNGDDPPPGPNERTAGIAKATGTVVAELGMVPNQPLIFHDDGKPRYEDDLIGYAWAQFLDTGEARWLPRNAMVKSAVRAMDAVTAVMASKTGGERKVDRFVVAGGSKRGWTAWLVGAMDDRVVGVVPIVIDVLNVEPSMRHHFAAYGFWAPSVGDYVAHGIMRRFGEPRLTALYDLVDPYAYRHRLAMPKLVLNAAGDQFFLPDSSPFYWHDLQGPKALRYVPNADHGLGGTDALETLIAFHTLLVRGESAPQFSWQRSADGGLRVHAEDTPEEVWLWQATNPRARDFRMETLGPAYTKTALEADAPGVYAAHVAAPPSGWTAWFLELVYDVGAPTPLKLTTEVVVTPDDLPFADKPINLPASATMICRGDAAAIRALAESAPALGEREDVASDGLVAKVPEDGLLYVNWTPSGDFRTSGAIVREFLQERGCDDFNVQLESGPGMTLPPVAPASD